MNSDDLDRDLFDSLTARVSVRGYSEGALKFEDQYEKLKLGDIDAMAVKHAVAFGNRPFMVEFEFLDEPDPLQRFLRFGTDKSGMVAPVLIDLTAYPD